MDKKLIVSPSPHVHSGNSTSHLMRDVLIALVPAFAVTVFFGGLDAVVVTALAVASCIVCEYVIERFLIGRQPSIGDYSAILTGVLLGFNLPASLPLWMVVIGSFVAIGVGKMSFGGLGRNLFNPALVGRVFLLVSFPVAMTTFPEIVGTDAFSGATPLAFLKEALKSGQSISEISPAINYQDLMLGAKSGSLGEIASVALLIGFVYLLWRKVISWHIPISIFATVIVFGGILWLSNPGKFINPIFHLLTGGMMLGAIFMATDYVTSPMTHRGMIIFGVGIGLITILIRDFGAYPEGISFAILIMNATVPLINKYVKPRRFGVAK